LLYRSQLG